MTTEELNTSVDGELKSIEEQIAELREQQRELAKTQAEEREAAQRQRFNQIVDVDTALAQDWEALEEIGIVGFTVQTTPDPDGGPEVRSVTPILKRTSKPRAASSGTGGGKQRDLAGTFEEHATPEERAAAEAAAGDGNKTYAIRLKVWNRVHGS